MEPLDRERYTAPLQKVIEIGSMDQEIVLSAFGCSGWMPVKTCVGDITLIINMLMDYAGMLDRSAAEWEELNVFEQAYRNEYASRCRKVASKFANQIGYSYEQAVRNCTKKMARQQRQAASDIGLDSMELAASGWKQERKKKPKSEAPHP